MMELVSGIAIAGLVLALVLEPLVRSRPQRNRSPDRSQHELEVDFSDVEESASPKVQALLALREIEFDRETGKLSDEDYSALKAVYQDEALAAIREEESEASGTDAEGVAVCPACGPRSESRAKFCSNCGRRVSVSGVSRLCNTCGARAPDDARFCGECGANL